MARAQCRLLINLRNGDAAAGAYAAGLSAGQAMVAQPPAAKPVKAPKAKKKWKPVKYATLAERAKHDPEFRALLASQECHHWVRGT